MDRDTLFETRVTRAGDFAFDAEVARVFDDMVVRSIPFYAEQQRMVQDLARKYWLPGTSIYDLGCSTATTLIQLALALPAAQDLIGYDNAPPMLDSAREKIRAHNLEQRIRLRPGDLNDPPATIDLQNAGLVTLCWTLQFIRPSRRDALIRWIFDALAPRGVLCVTEKILGDDRDVNETFIELYHDFKRGNGYSENEIARKREALENVLIPYSIEENLALFRRSGFETAEPFFQWHNFAAFLCVKE